MSDETESKKPKKRTVLALPKTAQTFDALVVEQRQRDFVDQLAAQLWTHANPIEDRIDQGSGTEAHLDRIALFCKEEAERLWKVLHP